MNEELKKVLLSHWSVLPAELQKAILDPELSKKVIAIGTEHKLHIDQIEKLEEETILLMLGITSSDDFLSSLKETLHVDQSLAEKIAESVGTKIVVPVREIMKSHDVANAPKTQIISAAPSPPAIPPPAPPKEVTQAPVVLATTPTLNPEMHQADKILTEATVSKPPTPSTPSPAPQDPKSYTTDPYREPPTP